MSDVASTKSTLAEFLTTVALGSLLFAGCGGNQPTTATVSPSPTGSAQATPKLAGTVIQTRSGCSLSLADGPIAAGRVALTFVNQSGVVDGFDVFEIPQGRTYAEAEAFTREARRQAELGQPGPDHTDFFIAGNPISHIEVDPGEMRTFDGDFQPGTYTIVCLRKYEQVNQIRPFVNAGPLIIGQS